MSKADSQKFTTFQESTVRNARLSRKMVRKFPGKHVSDFKNPMASDSYEWGVTVQDGTRLLLSYKSNKYNKKIYARPFVFMRALHVLFKERGRRKPTRQQLTDQLVAAQIEVTLPLLFCHKVNVHVHGRRTTRKRATS
jgi:hypothetical protein